MPTAISNAQALAGVDVFKGLDGLELRELEKCAKEVAYPENKVIFREGEVGDKMFLILDGVVEIWKSDGKELKGSRLARLQKNEVFGEMAVFDKEPRSASAYAVIAEETRILVWDEKDILQVIKQNPNLGVKLLTSFLRKISNRLRHANDAVHTLLRANRYIGL